MTSAAATLLPARGGETGAGVPGVLAIVGPTASGKSAVGLRLARELGGEIVSLDSRQIYRGMDIGTAKPTLAERAAARHHGLDLVEPGERFSAGRFARDARTWIRDIRSRGRHPILVGGTGFFLRALLEPLFREPVLDPRRRRRLESVLDAMGVEECVRWLELLDPSRARLAEEGGMQRIRRALEVPLLSGRSLTWWHQHAPVEGEPVDMQVVLLEADPEWLSPRIRLRVESMIREGLVEEVDRLLQAGFHEGSPGMSGTGYREVLARLRGETDHPSAVEAIVIATRQYARRQRTWFRHQLPADTIRLDAARGPELLVRDILAAWQRRGTVA
jgi:tRNA dimethylallyltransferase